MTHQSGRRFEEARFSPGDLIAGVSVALVLIPQSLAYAGLAGVPAIHGLYAAMLAPIVAAIFVSSPNLQTGPVAMTSVLVFGALSAMATPMTSQYVALAALLALVVGVVRVMVGLVRGGFIAYLMSQPVLVGFTTAAAILIVSTQLPTALGSTVEGHGIMGSAVWSVLHPQSWSLPAVAISIVTFGMIIGGQRLHPLFPGVLIAVLLGLGYSLFTGYGGTVIGEVPEGLPPFSLDLPWGDLPQLIVPGVVIALVGFAEPAAIARTMAAQTRQPWSADREFVSQGMANLAAGISGGFAVGGSFSRTMVNRAAGGRTRWSGAITGLTVLAFLPVASVLAPLPSAVLAAVVIAAVIRLMEFRALIRITRSSRAQSLVAWGTFAATLILAPRIDLAVLLGVGMGVVVHLWRERRVQVNRHFDDHTLRLEPVGVLFFGSAPQLDEALIAELAKHPAAQRLVLDLRKVGRIDYTGALVLQRIAEEAEQAGLEVRIVAGAPPQGVRILERVMGPDSPWLVAERGGGGGGG